jgi:hypothetical protein
MSPRLIPAFLLGTTSAPDQFIVPTRDKAVSKALAFAKLSHTRAWLVAAPTRLCCWAPSGKNRRNKQVTVMITSAV